MFDYEFRLRVQAPRPTVFEGLLRIEHIARWFSGWARIEPKVGGVFRFGGETCIFHPEGRGWETKIEAGEVLRSFAFRWAIQGTPTFVSYELADGDGSSTLVVARHRDVPVDVTTCGRVQDAWRTCLGNLKSIAEGRAEGIRPDHTPPETDWSLVTIIDAPTARLFDALTDPAQVDRWSPGGMTLRDTVADPQDSARILDLEPNRQVRLGRRVGDDRIDLSLEEKASGTALYVSANGFPDVATSLRARGRWSDRLMCLRNLVEGGDPGFVNPYEGQVRAT